MLNGIQSRRLGALSVAVMLIALLVRLHGIGFGLPALLDPDELMFELGAIRLLSKHTLNPGWFGHPATTTMYLLALVDMATYGVGRVLGWFTGVKEFTAAVFSNPGLIILPGRVLMALFGVGTVWQVQRLARTLFGPTVALVAGLLLALSPVAVSWAQVIRSDVMASFFMLLGMNATLRYAREGQSRYYVWAAWWLGLAIATKWPFAMGGLAMAGVLGRNVLNKRLSLGEASGKLAGFAALSLLFLVLISPYLILAHDTVIRNLAGEAQMKHLGATGGPPWANAWWYVSGPLLRGLGWAGSAFVLIGLVGGFCGRWRSGEGAALLLPVLVGLTAILCSQHLVWERWALPLLPILAIVAGAGVQILSTHLNRAGGFGVWFFAAAIIVGPLASTCLTRARERGHDTRMEASSWAVAHIPNGSSVLIEHFAFDLYPQPWKVLFPLGDAGCVEAKAMLAGRVDNRVIEQARGNRSNVDYGTLAPIKRPTCRANYAILSQYDRYADERNNFPEEYRAYQELLSHGRVVATFSARAGESSGPVIRIFQRLR